MNTIGCSAKVVVREFIMSFAGDVDERKTGIGFGFAPNKDY
jgi:hypothetical protein